MRLYPAQRPLGLDCIAEDLAWLVADLYKTRQLVQRCLLALQLVEHQTDQKPQSR